MIKIKLVFQKSFEPINIIVHSKIHLLIVENKPYINECVLKLTVKQFFAILFGPNFLPQVHETYPRLHKITKQLLSCPDAVMDDHCFCSFGFGQIFFFMGWSIEGVIR